MKDRSILQRVIIDVILIVAIIHGWWFIALPAGIVGVFIHPYFFEFILAGIMYDALFGLTPDLGTRGYIGTIVSVAAWIVIRVTKGFLRT